MSDLISRKDLLDELQNRNIPYNAEVNDVIVNQPIAYDVDRVVEKIHKLLGNHRLIPHYLYDKIEDVIRKGGGV